MSSQLPLVQMTTSYLVLLLSLPFGDRFADQVEIFFVKLGLLLALLPALALLPTAPFIGIFNFFLFVILVFVYDEAFTDLDTRRDTSAVNHECCLSARVRVYLCSLLFIVIIFVFFTRVVHLSVTIALPLASLAGFFIEGVVVLIVIQLSFA